PSISLTRISQGFRGRRILRLTSAPQHTARFTGIRKTLRSAISKQSVAVPVSVKTFRLADFYLLTSDFCILPSPVVGNRGQPGTFAIFSPKKPMFDRPIQQGSLKADVVSCLFAFNPFITQNLVAFGQEFLVNEKVWIL